MTKSSGSALHLGKTALVTEEVAALNPCFSNFMQRLRPAPGYEPRFLYWFLNSPIGREEFNYYGTTTTGLANISGTLIASIRFPAPPLSEQCAIADFLDRETARIDALVAKKRRMIELIHMLTASAIHEAVLRGTSPCCKLRDSGIPWMGRIPSHWPVRRLKQVARLESGHTPSRQHPEYWLNCTIPWVSLADVHQFRGDSIERIMDTAEYVSEVGLANSSARLLPAGTVILSRTASVGFSCILGRDMATTQDFADWICGPELLPEYLLYVFRAMRPEFQRLTMGSTHKTIYMPDIAKFVVPVPPVSEQHQIVARLHEAKQWESQLSKRAERQIERLVERRHALITAAVTGQLDIAEAAA